MNPKSEKKDTGVRRMIKQGKQKFRIPENTEYYSRKHFKRAEKKFIKLCVIGGKC